MANCPVCLGEGLIGSGPFPSAREGDVKTCPNCEGNGKVEDMPVENAPESEVQA